MKYKRSFGYLLCAIAMAVSGMSECRAMRTVAERSIVVIIPSYNNAQWYKRNLDSVFSQKYSNYRVIYCEDCWTEGGGLVQQYKEEYDTDNRITLICNDTRRGAMANMYDAVHSCDDNAIIAVLDGDDWFAHDDVLATINRCYENHDVWLTYGSIRTEPRGGYFPRLSFPNYIINDNGYRAYRWITFPQRTFYAWLFKRIKKEDLMYEGDFLPMTYDLAMMFPMLEMSGGRFMMVREVLYIYNRMNAINDDKVNRMLQLKLDEHIRSLPRYQPLGSIRLRS